MGCPGRARWEADARACRAVAEMFRTGWVTACRPLTRQLWASYLIVTGSMLDLVTTLVAVDSRSGAREGNPVVVGGMDVVGVAPYLLALTVVCLAASVPVAGRAEGSLARGIRWALIGLGVLKVAVGLHNAVLIGQLHIV